VATKIAKLLKSEFAHL